MRKDSLLRVSEDLSILSGKAGEHVALLRDRLFPITDFDLGALEVFRLRRSLESGVRALNADPGNGKRDREPAPALAAVSRLVDTGLLEEDRHAARQYQRLRGMFGSRLASLSDVQPGDVVVYGVPYDLGVTGQAGTERGPDYLRFASATAFDYACDERHLGWWHPGRQAQVLKGVPIRDIGDVDCAGTARNGEAFDRVYKVQTKVLELGGFPMMIGGDHSTSLPVIAATASRHPGLVVIQLDAHSDLGADRDMGDWRRNASHGNFMSWIAEDANVARVVQLGIRHLMADRPFQSDKVDIHAGLDWLARLDALLDGLPDDSPYYVTFDVDVLDPTVIGQTGTPIPGGLSYRDAVRVLHAIGDRFDLVGCDIVELRADRSLLEGCTVSYLGFELLASRDLRRQRLAG
ncbi:MAG: hypothetical protein Tsb0019_09010 [Roseibium sp.]